MIKDIQNTIHGIFGSTPMPNQMWKLTEYEESVEVVVVSTTFLSVSYRFVFYDGNRGKLRAKSKFKFKCLYRPAK